MKKWRSKCTCCIRPSSEVHVPHPACIWPTSTRRTSSTTRSSHSSGNGGNSGDGFNNYGALLHPFLDLVLVAPANFALARGCLLVPIFVQVVLGGAFHICTRCFLLPILHSIIRTVNKALLSACVLI